MHRSLKKTLAGTGVLAASVGFLVALGASSASAATTPPWESSTGTGTGGADSNSVGTITLYDASGNIVTGGSVNDKPIAAYAVGSAVNRTGDVTADVLAAQPNPNANIQLWNKDTLGAFTSYPLASGPAAVIAAAQGGKPVAKGAATDLSVADFIGEFPNTAATDSNTSYQDLYQLRLYSANSAGAQSSAYNTADILVNETANTWTQVYPTPAPVAVSTSISSITPSVVSPAAHGSTVTLTSTLSAADGSHPAGSVHLFDGSTDKGAATFTASSGAISATDTPADGSHSYTFQFTPADTTVSKASTSPALPYQVSAATQTALSVSGADVTGTDTVLTATVTPSAAAGTVAFFDNGTALSGTVTNPSAGTYSLTISGGVAAGAHSFVAKFTPTSPTQYAASQSQPQNVSTITAGGPCAQTGSQCKATANVQATVDTGTLVISTPYTASNPIDLGHLKLSADSKLLQGSANITNIVITDQRAGNLPYTVTALASNLNDGKGNAGSIINGQNLGLTGITATPGTGFTGTLTPNNTNTAANGVAPSDTGSLGLGGTTGHTIATADHGLGTVTLSGLLSLNAPSSTEPGFFQGTLTFTVG